MKNMPILRASCAVFAAALAASVSSGCGTPLPKAGPQAQVHSLAPARSGVLAQLEADLAERFGDQSGFLLLSSNTSGMRWRLAMIEHANTSLDLMYFIWQSDPAGLLLFDRLMAAADRGVRVRLLVDDMVLAAKDRNLAAICLHPNVDIKLYNPIKRREGLVGTPMAFLTRFHRANRRMHNKLMIADGRVALIGGRNIGDEYFGLAEKYNFRDLDVLAAGPVVTDLAAGFDEYWNTELSYPASVLSTKVTSEDLDQLRLAKKKFLEEKRKRLSSYPLNKEQFARDLSGLAGMMVPGKAWVVQDHPVPIAGREVRLVDMLGFLLGDSDPGEVLISSPYLIPVGHFMDSIREAVDEGATVKLLTASLGSNNHTAAHAHYAKYRRRFLATGAELYEADAYPSEAIRSIADVPPARAKFISPHMKAMVFDRERCFIGSLNLDPRAIELNTENGLYIESPELSEQLAEKIEAMMSAENAWRVHVDMYDRLYWTSAEGRVDRQPARHFGQRIASFFFRILPVESQL